MKPKYPYTTGYMPIYEGFKNGYRNIENSFFRPLGRLASFTAKAMAFRSIRGLAATTSLPFPLPHSIPIPTCHPFPSISLPRCVSSRYVHCVCVCLSLCGHVAVYGFALPWFFLAPSRGGDQWGGAWLGVFPISAFEWSSLGGCLSCLDV